MENYRKVVCPLRKLVYFDEEEKALVLPEIEKIGKQVVMNLCSTVDVNPPYSIKFLMLLKLWPVLYFVTEVLYILDLFRRPLEDRFEKSKSLRWGEYFLKRLTKIPDTQPGKTS